MAKDYRYPWFVSVVWYPRIFRVHLGQERMISKITQIVNLEKKNKCYIGVKFRMRLLLGVLLPLQSKLRWTNASPLEVRVRPHRCRRLVNT